MIRYIVGTAVVLSAVLLYLFLIFPSRRRAFPVEFTLSPIAHRGIHGSFSPENSISAIMSAVRSGRPVEIDVRLTKDGVPVVIHDSSLERMCGVQQNVADITFEKLAEYRLTNSSEAVPSLKQVLEEVNGESALLIELKGEDTSDVASRVAEVLKRYSGKVAVESFNPYHLMRFRRKMPEVPIGILSGRGIGKTPFTAFFGALTGQMVLNFLFRPDFISWRKCDRLTVGVRLCRILGASIVGWTFVGNNEYLTNVNLFDGLICDVTDGE